MTSRRSVQWVSLALFDLNAIYDFHRRRNAVAARRLMHRIGEGAEMLVAHPEAGPVAPDLEPEGRYRHVLVGPYRIIYRLDEERVFVLRIWDSRRNPDDLVVHD